MSHPTLKVGIIGLGVGESHIAGYNLSESCKVIALCDFDKQKLFEVGARHPGIRLFDDAASILNDPTINVVSIATFDTFHYEQIITAIKNGKHVFVEKPLSINEEDLDKLIEKKIIYI